MTLKIIKPSKLDWRYWLAKYRYWKMPKKEKEELRKQLDSLLKAAKASSGFK